MFVRAWDWMGMHWIRITSWLGMVELTLAIDVEESLLTLSTTSVWSHSKDP